MPGYRGDIRLSRTELDDAIRRPLHGFVAVFDEALGRNGIRDLVAVVSVGGGANIPAVTTMLSGHLRVPVVTTPRPQLTAAIGGAMRAVGGPGDNSATALTPAAPATATARALAPVAQAQPAHNAGGTATAEALRPGMMRAVAWSEAGDGSRAMPDGAGTWPKPGFGHTSARPALNFEPGATPPEESKNSAVPRRRLPAVAIIGAVVAVLLVGTALAIGLGSAGKPATTPGTSTTTGCPGATCQWRNIPAPAGDPAAAPAVEHGHQPTGHDRCAHARGPAGDSTGSGG